MKQILCLSTQPWSHSPGRTQQLVSRLKDSQVLYFAPSSGIDSVRSGKGRQIRPNVMAYSLPPRLVPPERTQGWLLRADLRRLGRFVSERVKRHRFHSPLLWTTSPEQVHLLDRLGYDGLVYDCERILDGLPPSWEGCLANAADVVFAASAQLCDRLSPCSSNIALLPNGVSYPLFSNQSADARRDPLPHAFGPALGFAGRIHWGLDLSPVLYAALARPDWTFLLLGRQEGNRLLPQLRRLPNVILAGPCPLYEVPDWLHRCNILLELLQENRCCDDVISPRVYEYLATGKPIVSMLWPDQVEPFPDVIYGAGSQEDFLALCQRALLEAQDFVSQRRRAHAQAAAWSNRAAEVSRILNTAGLL